MTDWVQHHVVLVRITLLNERRSSEAARLLVTDWVQHHEGSNSPRATRRCCDVIRWRLSWARETLSSQCSSLPNAPQHSICLADSNVREKAGVSNSNRFLFEHSDKSQDGSIGYNEIRNLCKQIGIEVITVTGMRYRAWTAFWSMDVSAEDIDYFMEHVGHHRNIDKNIYSCPPALRVMQTVTPILEKIDGVSLF